MNPVERLLNQVIDVIQNDPKRFAMEYWEATLTSALSESDKIRVCFQITSKYVPSYVVTSADGSYKVPIDSGEEINFTDDTQYPACNTIACIAGWCSIIMGNPKFNLDAVTKLFEDNEYPSWYRLFYVWNWPAEFRNRWDEADTREERVNVAVDRIRDYIITEKRMF